MGCRLIPLLLPATLEVSFSISRRTSVKSLKRRFGMWWNSAHSDRLAWDGERYGSTGSGALSSSGTLMSWRMRGRLVTMPLPRGRKSRPTMFSKTDDLPADCEPTTTCTPSVRECADSKWGYAATHNLWQVKRVAADGIEDEVLQLVDSVEQVVSEGRHRDVRRLVTARGNARESRQRPKW